MPVNRLEYRQHQLMAILLLGVQVDGHITSPCCTHQFQHGWHQLRHHQLFTGGLIARMQRRQFDGDAGIFTDNGLYCLKVLPVVPAGIIPAQGRLTEHVKGVAIAFAQLLLAIAQRLVNSAPEDKVLPHDLHGLVNRPANHRLAQPVDQFTNNAGRRTVLTPVEGNHFAGQQQTPCGCIDQQRVTLTQMFFPVSDTELVADQSVSGVIIRNTHQCFGQAHQQDAFTGIQAVLQQQGINHADTVIAQPDLFNECGGQLGSGLSVVRMVIQNSNQLFQPQGFVDSVMT